MEEEFVNALDIWVELSNDGEGEKVLGEVNPTTIGFWIDLSDEESHKSDFEVKGITHIGRVYLGPTLVAG